LPRLPSRLRLQPWFFRARALLLLDDPASKYMPEIPQGGRISLRHLLTHTSGIPNINQIPENERVARFRQTPQTHIDIIKNKPLDFSPGARYAYSNSNYNVLAYVIEKVGGKPYGDFLRDNIFVPVSLKNTRHDGDAAEVIRGAADLPTCAPTSCPIWRAIPAPMPERIIGWYILLGTKELL
jgi:CubicO group peptidase (beta-lactamase class C family)